jgi:hypothetical protein
MDPVMSRIERWERSGLPTPSSATLQPAPPPSLALSGPSGIRLALPREYDGMAAGCKGFLLQLDLYLATVHPTPSGEESVNVLVSCFSGKALESANAVWEGPDSARDHYPEVREAVFDNPPEGRAAGEWLCHLRQETGSAQDYPLEFLTLAADAGWNDRALMDTISVDCERTPTGS